MKTQHVQLRRVVSTITAGLGLFVAGKAWAADRVELTDGSVILGKLISAEGGKFKFETTFAGTIELTQSQVKGFTTDEAVFVGLNGGSTVQGKVELTDTGIKVVATDGQMSAATANVAAVWRPGADSPEVRKLKTESAAKTRKWKYEANVALAGRTGPQEKFGGAAGFKATLESSQDKLVFTAAAEKARENGRETANSQKGAVDYSAFFTPTNVWYVRTGIEKDKIKALDLRSTSAFGLGHKVIKSGKQDLELRLGASYLYETYSNGTKFDSPGLDVAMLHSYQFSNSRMTNTVSYTPAFKNFSNYRVHHESAIEFPLGASLWKLRTGIANDYQSMPPAGTERLDTTYYTSLVLNWE